MSDLRELLALEKLAPLQFVARHAQINRSGAVYGGQLLAQLARAAELTVEGNDWPLHSLQATFERLADVSGPIEYVVERTLDGRTESVRHVRGMQRGRLLLSACIGFGPGTAGLVHGTSWQTPPPPPESLPPLHESAVRLAAELSVHGHSRIRTYPQVELRPLDARRHLLVDTGPPLSRFWIRALSAAPAADLPAAPLVAYLSDYLGVNSVLAGHVHELPAESLFVATLNHSLWWHAPADPGDWLYHEFESPWAGGSRALCTGRIFSRQGQLLASVAQAVMLRQRRAQDPPLPLAGESLVL